MKKSRAFINGLALKIIAVALMTLDHVALFFFSGDAYIAARSVGRLAFPLFVFLAVEGVYHSRHPLRYGLILLAAGLAMDLVVWPIDKRLLGNVFTDLGCGVLTVGLLKRRDRCSLLAVLPVSLIALATFWPAVFHADYGLYGLVMFLLFGLAYELAPRLVARAAERSHLDKEAAAESYDRFYRNALCALLLLAEVCAFYLIFRYDHDNPLIPFSFNIESWSMFAGLLLLPYNGRRGYHSPVLKYGFYLYYPLHLIALYFLAVALVPGFALI